MTPSRIMSSNVIGNDPSSVAVLFEDESGVVVWANGDYDCLPHPTCPDPG